MAERTYLWGYGSGPYGSAGRKTKAEILAMPGFAHCEPELMRRLFALADYLIDHGFDFGFGGGTREFAEQDAEFRRRHYVVPCPGGIWKYDGKCWARYSWAAPYAPPGNSWHERLSGVRGAMALDALGNHNEATKVCAKYGLVNGISGEAWHYQPVEIPHARSYGQVWPALPLYNLPNTTPPPPPPPAPTPSGDDDMILFDFPPRIYSTRPDDGAVVTHPPITDAGGGKLRIPVPFSAGMDHALVQVTIAPLGPGGGWFRVCRGGLDPLDARFKHSNGNYGLSVAESSPCEVQLDVPAGGSQGEFMFACSTPVDVIIDLLGYTVKAPATVDHAALASLA